LTVALSNSDIAGPVPVAKPDRIRAVWLYFSVHAMAKRNSASAKGSGSHPGCSSLLPVPKRKVLATTWLVVHRIQVRYTADRRHLDLQLFGYRHSELAKRGRSGPAVAIPQRHALAFEGLPDGSRVDL
jgi:hypothetical protein